MKQYIYGKNTILEALKGEKRVYTVYVQNNFKDNKIIELCKKTNQGQESPLYIVGRDTDST